MHGAGQRRVQPPNRYDPSAPYPPPQLPLTDFDITMGNAGEDFNNSLSSNSPPLSLTSLKRQIDDMNEVFNQQLDSFARRYTELDEKFQDLCVRVDEIDTDITTRLTQVQTNFHKDFGTMQSNITKLQEYTNTSQASTLSESMSHVNSVQRSIKSQIQTITDRLCGLEGQASRLSAIENKLQLTTLNPLVFSQSLPTENISQIPSKPSNILSSTAMPNISQHHIPPQHSISSIPAVQPSQDVPHHSCSFSNNASYTSGVSLDPTRIPKYDGQLSPLHPADFLDKVDQYFFMHNAPDKVKINFVSDNFTGKALLWYTTLLPPPSIYKEFVESFQNYFWSPSLQRSIRNDLYRPYYHRDTSTMSEHAMDWINRARHLQPPIDQAEMVDQITSHFSYNISLALRGLRILTTNDLIQQLTYLQRAHAPPNNHSNNNNNSSNGNNSNPPHNSQQQTSYNNTSAPYNPSRYPPRQNNYNRNQYNNSRDNTPAPQQQSGHVASPAGNSVRPGQ